MTTSDECLLRSVRAYGSYGVSAEHHKGEFSAAYHLEKRGYLARDEEREGHYYRVTQKGRDWLKLVDGERVA